MHKPKTTIVFQCERDGDGGSLSDQEIAPVTVKEQSREHFEP